MNLTDIGDKAKQDALLAAYPEKEIKLLERFEAIVGCPAGDVDGYQGECRDFYPERPGLDFRTFVLTQDRIEKNELAVWHRCSEGHLTQHGGFKAAKNMPRALALKADHCEKCTKRTAKGGADV